MIRLRPQSVIYVTLALVGSLPPAARCEEPVDFNRVVRPLLAEKCLPCHGPDEEERKADLRLDVRQSAVDAGAIVPNNPDKSELIRRILADDPDEVMPPPETGEVLTAEQRNLIWRLD